ncbi:MAG: hypothetical protein IIY11_02035, partial [Clostridia bacterium]|nr:hypothetical protein [Clostridia bacterium]
SQYMQSLVEKDGAKLYEMTDNYRSASAVVEFANRYVQRISGRMKQTPIQSVTGEDGKEAASINFAEYLELHKNHIDPQLNECIIPIRIEFLDKVAQISITLPSWYIEMVQPIF